MTNPPPTPKEWQSLYDAAIRVKELAPWTWMEEIDLFGVQNPDTGELGFVSVMGMIGEHFGISVYLGAEGLYQFWGFQLLAPNVDPLELLQMPQLQASFEDRSDLEQRDRDTIKELGYKFRGRQAWPAFRHYHPGLAPWFVDGPQSRFLAHALEQLLDVALRFKTDTGLLPDDDMETYLVRASRKKAGKLNWEDQLMRIPPPEPLKVKVEANRALVDTVKRLPKRRKQFEADCFMIPTPIGKKGSRPYYPYGFMLVDSATGMILGFELLQPLPSVEAMWDKMPDTILRLLAKTEMRPRKIIARAPRLVTQLEIIGDYLGFEVAADFLLPALDEARYDFETFLQR